MPKNKNEMLKTEELLDDKNFREQYISRNDEWDKVQQTITAILQDNGINANKFYEKCNLEMKKRE